MGAEKEGSFFSDATFAQLRAEVSNAIVDNAIGGYLPPYHIPETRPAKPRVHTDKQIRQIAQSIESFGFSVPLLIDDQRKVIAGHGRRLAALRLGWDTVPAIKLSHLTESQRMAFLIADNRLTENSSWDERMLGEQLKVLSELELDFDLETIGFEVPEVDLLIDGLNTVPEADPDDRLPEISVRQGNGNTPIYQGGSLATRRLLKFV